MIKNAVYASLIFAVSSCSYFNDKQVSLPIKSNPPGASIYIEGRYYGQTPTAVKLEPNKNYQATIAKKGYTTSNITLESWPWGSVRENVGGADMTRCVLDATVAWTIIPLPGLLSSRCGDFKQKEYVANLMSDPNYQASPVSTNPYEQMYNSKH